MSEKMASLYRARLAKEKGAVRKDWGGRISVALVYPNYYRVGMSNLGFQTVYHLFNENENVVAERAFLPDEPETSLYLEAGKGLLSLESLSPLQEFDIVAFSLSFENDYPNILKILQAGRIPLLSEERKDLHPLIMAGGITTFLNPEPLALFVDCFLLGEAEANLSEFLAVFEDARNNHDRREVLQILARTVKSLYVPELYRVEYYRDGTVKAMEPVEAHIPEKVAVACHDSPRAPVTTTKILTEETEFSNRILVELGRGCGRSCRFCAAGYVYRPPRIRHESDLTECVQETLEKCDRIGLLSAAVSDIPGIEKLTGLIAKKGGDFSVSSLRADSLSEALLEDLKTTGQKTLAIAPEAGSERLRKVINKHLTEAQIIDAVGLITSTGGFNLRLYFLIGLPTETREDVREILHLVRRMKHQMIKESRSRGRMGQIKLSINCFVPKPFTPFQWFPLENVSSLKEKQKWLRKALGKEGGVRVSFDIPKWAYVQCLLSMGDRRVGAILLKAHELNGDWKKAFRSTEINPDFFVHRARGLKEILPWDFMDHGIHKEYLIKEYKLSLKAQESDVCHVGECERCGVCRN